jgi:hypothetical protein
MSKLFMAVVPCGAVSFKSSVSMRAHDRALVMSDLFNVSKEIILITGASQEAARHLACIFQTNISKIVLSLGSIIVPINNAGTAIRAEPNLFAATSRFSRAKVS